MNSTWRRRIGLALILAVAGCKKPGPEGPFGLPPAPVSVAVAEAKDVPVYLDEIGRAVAREVVTIQPQVSGQVVKLHFADGSDLKAGTPLFTIDARPYEAQLAAAQATLAQSIAVHDLAKLEFGRSEKLLEQQAISQQDFDTTKNAVAVAEARVKQNQAAVETAQLNLNYCSIQSPIDGRAGQRLVDVGNIVEANQTSLLVIQKLDPIYADFTVAEKSLLSVQRQMAKGPLKVEVRLADEAGEPVAGELTFVDNSIQRDSGTVKLRATVANPDRRLWPGRFVKVRLILDTIKGAVLIPARATQLSALGPYVFVVGKDSTAEMRQVTLGQRHGDLVVIEQGVQAGDPIVTTIHQFLQKGGKLQVMPPPAPAPAPAQGEKP